MNPLPMLAAAALLLACATASACEEPSRPADGYQGWQFEWDNDAFARTDRWFTNALRLTWVYCDPPSQQSPLSAEVVRLGRNLLGARVRSDGTDGRLGAAYAIGQVMYTPADIAIATPQRDDRPWAGYLFGGLTVFGYKGREYQATDVKLGWTGKASLAGQTQRAFHKAIDAEYPAGWEQQLRSRLGLQLGHLRLTRYGDAERSDRLGFHTGYGGNVGTLRTYGSVHAGLTYGRLRSSNPVFAVNNDGDLIIQDFGNRQAFEHWLLFANISGTAIVANRFVTGNTDGGRSEIRLRRAVGAMQLGVSAPKVLGMRLLYVHTVRTSEFESRTTPRDGPTQRWGTISLNYDAKL